MVVCEPPDFRGTEVGPVNLFWTRCEQEPNGSEPQGQRKSSAMTHCEEGQRLGENRSWSPLCTHNVPAMPRHPPEILFLSKRGPAPDLNAASRENKGIQRFLKTCGPAVLRTILCHLTAFQARQSLQCNTVHAAPRVGNKDRVAKAERSSGGRLDDCDNDHSFSQVAVQSFDLP